MIRKLEQLDLGGRRVFLRADFNVPVRQGKITETHRIDATLPTLRFILEKAGKLLIASHLGRPGGMRDLQWSLAPVREYLETSLSCPVTLAPDCIGTEVDALIRDGRRRLVLLENLRFHEEEEKNDPAFSRALASLADIYVNDAFGAAHRAHASTVGMAAHFKIKGAGFLLQKEIDYLGRLVSDPDRPFVAILGGAKVSDKIGVVKNLMAKMNSLLIGGGMAYTFLKAKGVSVGKSLVEEERVELAREMMAQAEKLSIPLLLPIDHIAADESRQAAIATENDIPPNLAGLDIGEKTRRLFIEEIRKAKTVLWNGPVGLFEEKKFAAGTRAIARALADCAATTIVAGGDTVAAVMEARVEKEITHLSTGGGATLEFLEGRKLPGLVALEESA